MLSLSRKKHPSNVFLNRLRAIYYNEFFWNMWLQTNYILHVQGGVTNHLCEELYGRLAYFKDRFPRVLGKLVRESEEIFCQQPTPYFRPISGCFQPPGKEIEMPKNFGTIVTHLYIFRGEMLLLYIFRGAMLFFIFFNKKYSGHNWMWGVQKIWGGIVPECLRRYRPDMLCGNL